MTESATTHLTASQKRHLRQLAHHLSPVVMIGDKGLHAGVYKELEQTLDEHELIKVRISGVEREEKAAMIEKIIKKAKCHKVTVIGHIAVLYRAAKDPVIKLPKAG